MAAFLLFLFSPSPYLRADTTPRDHRLLPAVSDGYGVYQNWVHRRQTCWEHLIRTARGLSEQRAPELAACGAWALAELQQLCHMAKAPPSGGEWNAWYARLCNLIGRYHARQDDAGRLADGYSARWRRCGCFWWSTGWMRPIIALSGHCVLAYCGANAPMGPRV